MRKRLEACDDQRLEFTGVFDRIGMKHGYKGPLRTVLLQDVRFKRDGSLATDHLWFNLTHGFDDLGLKHGEKVEFVARVGQYLKGYQGRRNDYEDDLEIDYCLTRPTKLRRVGVALEDDERYKECRAARLERKKKLNCEAGNTRFRKEGKKWWIVGFHLVTGSEEEVFRQDGSTTRVIVGERVEFYRNGKIRAAFTKVEPKGGDAEQAAENVK